MEGFIMKTNKNLMIKNRNSKKYLLTLVSSVLFLFLVGACASTTGVTDNSKLVSQEGTPLVFDSEIIRGNLDNGMAYFVRHNEEPKNRISLRLVVRAGSAMEEDNQQGIAHFIEHMAFNGTEHFEKSAIVDYFESIGMNFGSELNAYTSFEETVYKLEIPADNPEILEQSLLILRDWACGITFAEEEIEKERGVINEEWRLRQGLQGRITDSQFHFLLKDSKFENRLPIGKMDVINSITRDDVLEFYRKWYRPDLMSIVVVGDEDTAVLESAIQNMMNSIPKNNEKIEVPEYRIPVQTEKSICHLKDLEQKYTIVNIFIPEDFSPRKTEEEFKQLLLEEISSAIFNQRVTEITNTADAPWLAAGVGENQFTNFGYFYYLGFVPKNGMFTEAAKAFFDEYDRFINFGITESELERFKQYYISQAENLYINKDKINSDSFCDDIVYYVLVGKTIISQEDYYRLYKSLIPEITVDEINNKIKTLFPERGTLMYILSQDTADDIPQETELMKLWTEYANQEIMAYADDVSDDDLMERPSKKGKVVSSKEIKEFDAKEYLLDNGIKIITKKTDFEANRINMKASSKGGLFYVDDDKIPSARLSLEYLIMSGLNGMTYNQLIKKITSKQVGINFSIDDTNEYFDGSCTGNDAETLLQLLNLLFTKSQFNEDGWNVIINNYKTVAKNHGLQPNDLYVDKINEILYGDDIRRAPVDLSYIEKMDPEKAASVYYERFANPADFTYMFIGDFDEEQLIDLCCYYLGSLETSNQREESLFKYWDFPKGKTSAVVKKGLDNQGMVYICFGGELPKAESMEKRFYENEMLNQLRNVLDIRLREVIREDKSGSYGINVGSYISGYPERYYRFSVEFGCEPERQQELTDTVISVIEDFQTNGIPQIYIDKVKESILRNYEVNKRNNYWWMDRIELGIVFEEEPMWFANNLERITDWITPEVLQDAAKKYLNTENYVNVFLKPEK